MIFRGPGRTYQQNLPTISYTDKYSMATIQELESFNLNDAVKFHKELNPRLWDEEKLDPEVRDQLLLIAEDFVEYLGIDNLKVEDVTISGSNAAYSYTPHSDLDLHILVNFNNLPNDPVYQELFTAKKTLYNDAHDITVREVPVELYVQDTNQVHTSLGEYSVVYDKWIRIPKKRRANFDQAATKLKYEKLGDLIELALKTRDSKRVKDTIDLVKRYRKSGLERAGEFGPENLAFKAIRKQGLIQDLYDLKAQLHGEKLSIEEDAGKKAAVLKIQKHLNKKYGANLDLDGKLGPLTLKSINKFMPSAKTGLADEPNKTTAVQGKKVKVKEYVDDIKSYRNPSPKTLYNLTKRSAHKHMRGMYHSGDTYWWDANDAIHADGSKLLGIPYDYLNRLEAAIDNVSGNYYVGGDDGVPAEITQRYGVEELAEASGYIPSEKEKNDPRFKMALTVDVKPDAIKKNAKAFGFKTSRAGIPPQARADGKIAEDLMREFKTFLGEQQEEMFPGYDEQHREKRLGNWLAKSWGVQNGKPQTFYHATTKDFDTFNTHGTGFASALGMAYEVERHGSFFAVDPKFAEGFIEDPNTGRVKEGGRVLPVHLSIQSPIDLRDDALSRMLSDEETVDEFKANNIDLRSIYNHFYELERWELFDGPEGAEFIDNLQKLGFDGAIINEAIPNNSNAKSGQVWVAFSPNQVKSVYNRGSFSSDDARLMRESADKFTLTPNIISQIEEWRHQCRVDNEGGGACHLVSEIIEGEWGFERQDGTYCTPDQRDICVGHYWNLLPDGSILDSTADQFGEGNNIRIVSPNDPEFKRYHPRFPRDFDYNDDEEYTRITDLDNQRYDKSQEYEKKHGEGWWLKDKKLYNKYKTDQRKYTG
jgi:hypothetical protein